MSRKVSFQNPSYDDESDRASISGSIAGSSMGTSSYMGSDLESEEDSDNMVDMLDDESIEGIDTSTFLTSKHINFSTYYRTGPAPRADIEEEVGLFIQS